MSVCLTNKLTSPTTQLTTEPPKKQGGRGCFPVTNQSNCGPNAASRVWASKWRFQNDGVVLSLSLPHKTFSNFSFRLNPSTANWHHFLLHHPITIVMPTQHVYNMRITKYIQFQFLKKVAEYLTFLINVTLRLGGTFFGKIRGTHQYPPNDDITRRWKYSRWV